MSILTDGGSGKYLSLSASLGTTFSVAFWFKPEDNLESNSLMDYFLNSDSAGSTVSANYAGAGSDNLTASQNGSGGGAASFSTSNAISDTNWHHCCIIINGASSRRVVLDGDWANSGVNTATRTMTAPDTLHFLATDSGGVRWKGYFAEACWWNDALSQSEAESLWASSETGPDPSSINAGNVTNYWPLTTSTTVVDQVGSDDLTNNGSMTFEAEHPDISSSGTSASPEAMLIGL